MNANRSIRLFIGFCGAAALVACASTMPPTELVNARNAYDLAGKGPAPRLDPADLHAAKEHLDAAEASFKEDGDTQSTRDQAYISTRKSELADSVGRTVESERNKDDMARAMHVEQTNAVAQTSAELARANSKLNVQGVALMNEQRRREDAESRAEEAAADLARFASVKQEPRGKVITLSGGVLFASAKWNLLPTAQAKLDQVAEALIREDPLSRMVVEGHTDSQGGAAYNQGLSQQRAQTVRDYLVARGVASDRISAQGFGLTRSVADNGSPEGRANNRRVEIVIQPASPTL